VIEMIGMVGMIFALFVRIIFVVQATVHVASAVVSLTSRFHFQLNWWVVPKPHRF